MTGRTCSALIEPSGNRQHGASGDNRYSYVEFPTYVRLISLRGHGPAGDLNINFRRVHSVGGFLIDSLGVMLMLCKGVLRGRGAKGPS